MKYFVIYTGYVAFRMHIQSFMRSWQSLTHWRRLPPLLESKALNEFYHYPNKFGSKTHTLFL